MFRPVLRPRLVPVVYRFGVLTDEIDENNHQDWLNKGPLYNTSICFKLHGSMFEYFITHARTDRYNLMCSLVAYDKIQPAY